MRAILSLCCFAMTIYFSAVSHHAWAKDELEPLWKRVGSWEVRMSYDRIWCLNI
jgi:hypothetical protein